MKSKQELSEAAAAYVVRQLFQRGWHVVPKGQTSEMTVVRDSASLDIRVRAKQQSDWPSCKGVPNGALLILVDYDVVGPEDVPDVFLLTRQDWDQIIDQALVVYRAKNPNRPVKIEDGYPVFLAETKKDGTPYRGYSVKRPEVEVHKNRWDKVAALLGQAPR